MNRYPPTGGGGPSPHGSGAPPTQQGRSGGQAYSGGQPSLTWPVHGMTTVAAAASSSGAAPIDTAHALTVIDHVRRLPDFHGVHLPNSAVAPGAHHHRSLPPPPPRYPSSVLPTYPPLRSDGLATWGHGVAAPVSGGGPHGFAPAQQHHHHAATSYYGPAMPRHQGLPHRGSTTSLFPPPPPPVPAAQRGPQPALAGGMRFSYADSQQEFRRHPHYAEDPHYAGDSAPRASSHHGVPAVPGGAPLPAPLHYYPGAAENDQVGDHHHHHLQHQRSHVPASGVYDPPHSGVAVPPRPPHQHHHHGPTAAHPYNLYPHPQQHPHPHADPSPHVDRRHNQPHHQFPVYPPHHQQRGYSGETSSPNLHASSTPPSFAHSHVRQGSRSGHGHGGPPLHLFDLRTFDPLARPPPLTAHAQPHPGEPSSSCVAQPSTLPHSPATPGVVPLLQAPPRTLRVCNIPSDRVLARGRCRWPREGIVVELMEAGVAIGHGPPTAAAAAAPTHYAPPPPVASAAFTVTKNTKGPEFFVTFEDPLAAARVERYYTVEVIAWVAADGQIVSGSCNDPAEYDHVLQRARQVMNHSGGGRGGSASPSAPAAERDPRDFCVRVEWARSETRQPNHGGFEGGSPTGPPPPPASGRLFDSMNRSDGSGSVNRDDPMNNPTRRP